MTSSDLEQTLAEARATAARRLEALKRLQEAHVGQETAPGPLPAGRDSPRNTAGPPLRTHVEAPQGPTAAPEVVSAQTGGAGYAPEPVIARAEPAAADLQPVGFAPAVAYPHQENSGVDYVPVGGVARNRPDPRSALEFQVADAAEAQPSAISSARLFATRMMQGALAGVATFRENRARSRALAQAQSDAELTGRARMPRPAKQQLTEKERRWERRRKRHFYEEILGWILVPTIFVALYFAALWILDLFGTTPDELVEGIKTIWAQFR